jgi:hypothetical protein
MNARRDDLIRLAAETLDCVGKTAHGHWIYRDDPTGLWMVDEIEMGWLGECLSKREPAAAYDAWCDTSSAMEVDVALTVADYGITAGTDLDALMVKVLTSEPPDIMTHLLLRFFRQDVVDTIRINEEIDRDADWCEALAEWIPTETDR